VRANDYRGNLYISGRIEGRAPTPDERARGDFSRGWYADFPTTLRAGPDAFRPAPGAPFLGAGTRSPFAPVDRNGVPRAERVDLGPAALR
jgi:hypothetical protein